MTNTNRTETEVRAEIWIQWNKQDLARIEREAQNQAYIKLNNLYLGIERGSTTLTIHTSNDLRTLVTRAYDRNDQMIEYWIKEFQKLPNWTNF